MPQEIERKFLVSSDEYKSQAVRSYQIKQGYLCKVPERTVRIRIKAEKAFITVKGKSNESGLSRYEWEREIPVDDAIHLLQFCEPCIIEKTRYEVPFEDHIFEVDEFGGDNAGLVVAEIELSSENEYFKCPNWICEEVTNVKKYYNSHLSEKPFKDWSNHT